MCLQGSPVQEGLLPSEVDEWLAASQCFVTGPSARWEPFCGGTYSLSLEIPEVSTRVPSVSYLTAF